MDQVFSYEALVHAIAGTAGGATAMTTFYPLEIIRTYIQVDPKYKNKNSLQVAKEMLEDEGLPILYKGLGSTLVSLACSNFVYFYTNNCLKVIVRSLTKQQNISTVTNLAIASLAGAVNVFVTCPLWVVNTRLKMQRNMRGGNKAKQQGQDTYSGLIDGMVKIAKKEGLLELWSGCWASLILVSNPTIQFVTYDKIRKIAMDRAKRQGRKTLSSLEFFILGAIAKAVSTIITYPIQLAQSKLRHGGHGIADKKPTSATTATSTAATAEQQQQQQQQQQQPPKKREEYRSTFHCLVAILRQDGFFGWFKGLNVKLLQTILMAAFHFLVYEKIAGLIMSVAKLDKKSKKVAAH